MSNEARFTPGPWESRGAYVYQAGTTRTIAETVHVSADSRSWGAAEVANARLIAAAPEMYEALEQMAAAHTASIYRPMALAALKKARGEPVATGEGS